MMEFNINRRASIKNPSKETPLEARMMEFNINRRASIRNPSEETPSGSKDDGNQHQ